MTPAEQAGRRVDLARALGVELQRWVASASAAATLPIADGELLGVPLTIGQPRYEWGLDLELTGRHR